MLDQDANKKQMMLVMRFVRMIAAALCALGLLYLVHKHRLKKAQSEQTPPTQTAPAENTSQQ